MTAVNGAKTAASGARTAVTGNATAARHADYREDRRDWHRDHDRYYRPAPPRVVYRPAPPPPRYGNYGWRVGSPYRNYYSGPVYVVNDYPRYHLRRPPYGHHWIRDDRGNMLLVAIATGVIAQYVLSGR